MLHYYRKGIGEPLILIHGFLSTNRVYDQVISYLTNKYDVIAIDLPGHGKSPLTNEKTVYDYAKKIIGLLTSLQIKNATWVGHSIGGYITMAAVEKYPEYVKRAAFLYSSPVADTKKEKQERDQHVVTIKTKGLDAFIKERIPLYFAFYPDPKDLEEAYRHAELTTTEGAIVATYAMKERPDQVNMVNQTQIPLFFLEGKKDLLEKPFHSSTPLITKAMTDTSHMGMFDNPEQFINKLQRWLVKTY
ncbi:alpha/beta fold hydrolase [Alkalihalobacillus deserti]|uniref:alpha/beta fold hydrolase n=1 Tax=Alkalihalobacillus deserti TaxID=2879466 RepID=UPI001D13F63B|nr:alpha/beta hydrolase [Alkalihalobacillus deserti]